LYLAGTRRKDGRMNVSLVSWFTQASFEPPLVVLGMHRESEAYAAVQETGVLALNLLGATQKDLVKPFFKHVEVQDDMAGPLEVREGPVTRCPVLRDLPAALELKLKATLLEGDHAVCLFEVLEAHVHEKDMAALDHKTAGLHYAG
ncbi:MAG TPA: flavin reductase family protein, partial [Candidatus Thermoplasmatota archaeon]|nr:flavin reductase family protein [Candidatus Thermoplasmatota archaeon]